LIYLKTFILSLSICCVTGCADQAPLSSKQPKKLTVDGIERGNNASDQDTYTLYRNSPMDPTFRLHIATFDSIEGYDDRMYNYENCKRAQVAFEKDPVFAGAQFFCDVGRFTE